MLKREFKEVAKQTLLLIISVFCLIYPIHLIASIFNKGTFVFSEYFLVFYQLFILFFSFFLGISLFSKEIRNSGFDYLLTLPYSRTKLLLYKIVPRITALVLLGLIYLVLLTISTSDPFLITPISFHALYLPLFFVSTSLSVLRGNFVANSIITGLLFIIFLFAANLPVWLVIRKYFGISESFKLRIFVQDSVFPFTPFSIVLLGFIISLPFILSLFHGFKTYDIRTSKKYIKRFMTLFIPLLVIALGLSYLMLNLTTSNPYDHYYITKRGVVLKWGYSGTYVLDGKREHRLPDFYLMRRNFYETEKAVYVSAWNHKTNPAGSIMRFNPDFSDYKEAYSPPEPLFLSRNLYGYRDTLVFLESAGKKYSWQRSGESKIVFLNTETGSVKKYKLPVSGLNLIGVTESGGINHLIGYYSENMGVTVYTLSEIGKVKKICRSSMGPVFQNGVLITRDKSDMVFGKFEGEQYIEVKREKVKGKLWTPYYLYSSDLNPKNRESLVLKIHKVRDYDRVKNPPPAEFVFLDLVNMTAKRFSDENVKRTILYGLPSGVQVLFQLNDWGDIKLEALYLVEGTSFRLLKDFSGEEIPSGSEFGMAGNGFGIEKGKDLTFFTLPDMKEIKY
ncbi:MAG: hypothetical protein ABFR36_03030 [Acidobacteriota bacterium]